MILQGWYFKYHKKQQSNHFNKMINIMSECGDCGVEKIRLKINICIRKKDQNSEPT